MMVELAFKWGERVAGSLQSYESMCFEGTWYSLYDCVFIRSGLAEPHIGKLMRLFEEVGKPKIRVRWFFRFAELPISATKVLLDEKDSNGMKEVFIAQGNMKGVENENAVEVILEKASVLCTAKCPRNPDPSQLHLTNAHHFFNKAYDVTNKKLVKIEKIDKGLAQKFFNKPEWLVVGPKEASEASRSPTSVGDFNMATEWSSTNISQLASGRCRDEGHFGAINHANKRIKGSF